MSVDTGPERRIRLVGGAQSLAMLRAELEDGGAQVDYRPPVEQRGAGVQEALHVIMTVSGKLEDAALGAIVAEAIKRVLDRFPRVTVEEVEPRGRQSDG